MDFLSFAKNMGKNIGKNISKNLSGKYSQNSQQINSETVTNENNKKYLKKDISPEERKKIIDNFGINITI